MILRLFWIKRTVSSSDWQWWSQTSCRRSVSWLWSESQEGNLLHDWMQMLPLWILRVWLQNIWYFRYTQAAVFFSLRSDRSVRSLLLITSTKHRAFIQFDCLSAGVWWRVSHQEEVEQQLPTNNDFHDWLICRWLSWLQLMVQSWSGQAKLLFCSSIRHSLCDVMITKINIWVCRYKGSR